jgi:Rsm1-like
MKMADPNIWQPELKQRYQSLVNLSTKLPENLTLPSNTAEDRIRFDLDRMAKALPDIVLNVPSRDKENQPAPGQADGDSTQSEQSAPAQKVNQTALALGLCGWSGQKVSGVELVHCDKCFQRCGLWLYTPSTQSKTRNAISLSDSPMSFDPVNLHRSYCPWKNALSQSATGTFKGLNGWQILVSLAEFVAERVERKEKQKVIDQEEQDGDYEERSWEEILAVDRDLNEKERELETRISKIKRVFTFKKKDGNKLHKRWSLAGGSRPTTGGSGAA